MNIKNYFFNKRVVFANKRVDFADKCVPQWYCNRSTHLPLWMLIASPGAEVAQIENRG